jgi:type IV secretion system protein VirB10
MSQSQSPVQAPASAVAQEWKYLTAKQKAGLLATTGVVIIGGMMAWSSHRHAVQERPAPLPPISQIGINQPFSPPKFPVAQPVVATAAPVMPKSSIGLSGVTGADPAQAALDSDIMGISADAANQKGGGDPARGNGSEVPTTQKSELAQRLTGADFSPHRAVELPNPDFLISQGRQIPCDQQTAIDTTFPGFIRATISSPVYGDTGNVILLDKGSRVFGSMEKAIINGLDRQFVLWNRITTPPLYDRAGVPHEYAIQIDSPAADEVGATGLQGDVDRHGWQKVKGAVLMSLLEGGIEYGIASAQKSGTSNLNISSGTGGLEQLPSQLLASQINIPDVLHRNQGLACTIFVARDLIIDTYSLRKR